MSEKKKNSQKENIKKGQLSLIAISAAVSTAGAVLLRVFAWDKGPYIRLFSAGIFFLAFLTDYCILRPTGKIGFSKTAGKQTLGAILALTAALLTVLPLLLLGDSVGALASYRAYTPFSADQAGGPLKNLLPGTLLPMLLWSASGNLFCLSCLSSLRERKSGGALLMPATAAILCGGLFALSMGEPLRLPAFLLLGAALAYITLLTGSFRLSAVFSLFFGLLLHLYEGYLSAFGQGALPKIAQNVGMLMIFFAVALPLWQVGIRCVRDEPRPKGAALWIPLLVSGILMISGCAVTGYAG